ncbi:hypothetical protein [Tengunoibacter tsumagoiensis]|uniref:Glycosyl hydrolase family 32 N-terminal domain-containing protein n=1 Tax=Tengunoibacter tsumagoiensis TaxID=2014871 RepID=A0A402A1J6_9CHLR|nr:hypothetical protein [Tengunoibacter tsumagoiensis]GCE12935.1 hypothetical protein KTT_27940 [Tengunoibacter tsumagoiensis]
MTIHARRLLQGPIITPESNETIGTNINGPSLIRVPDWVSHPLGRYYLYFAHHNGTFIRLAYSNHLQGPWQIYKPGTLLLKQTPCIHHIASPDVHIDHETRAIRMYYHGLMPDGKSQKTFLAVSYDGLHFTSYTDILGNSYFRVFQWENYYYALVMPGELRRSRNGLDSFEPGPMLFHEHMRHSAVLLASDRLLVFYSQVGDTPEGILVSEIALTVEWTQWKESKPTIVLQPERSYEGAELPLSPSVRGLAATRMHQLRDPAVYEEDGKQYLLYTVAGEYGIALAQLFFPKESLPTT